MRRWPFLLALLLFWVGPAAADDDTLAYRLYRDGRFAEAADLFADPKWRAAALYRSDQLWRAAEIWVRLEDADSAFNLGDAYARLGYTALALEAFLRAGALRPDFAEARANADLMRDILASDEERSGKAEPEAREIDRIEGDDTGGGTGPQETGDDEGGDAGGEGASGDAGATEDPPAENASEGESGEGAEPPRDTPGGSLSSGLSADGQADGAASGAATDVQPGDAPQTAAARARLERAQAAEQWLNALQLEPGRFLAARIALEARRRKAAGTLAQDAGSPW